MNRISELRKKLGLTQTRLGEEIGVSQQTISKYENVDENISGDMLLALSKFFKVPVDYILRKDEEEQQRESRIIKEKLWNCIGIWISTIEILGLL